MKRVLPFMLLIVSAGLMQASIVEDISLDLSQLHAGSTLSGMFTLSDTPAVGDTAPVVLTFSDPSDYSPTSLMSTITVGGPPPGDLSGFVVFFSSLTFTNLSGSLTPVNSLDINVGPFAFAVCASFPCTSSGGIEDQFVIMSTYTIAPAAAAVPEPCYAFAAPVLLAAIVFGRRLVRRA